MEFRPCIDIHNGKIKQIVGGSLNDQEEKAVENFVSEQDGAYYARFYRDRQIKNGHIILLNKKDSDFYEATKKQALLALQTYPKGLQIGGGITPENAEEFIRAGASHVIVTSYVFQDGMLNYKHLDNMVKAVGKQRLVLDLSCRKKDESYYIVTDRWQKFTDLQLDLDLLDNLSEFCDEFLVHGVDVEGKAAGIDESLVFMLGKFNKCPITYAGGVHNFEELKKLKILGNNKVHVTIGSALDLFGGPMKFEEVLQYINEEQK